MRLTRGHKRRTHPHSPNSEQFRSEVQLPAAAAALPDAVCGDAATGAPSSNRRHLARSVAAAVLVMDMAVSELGFYGNSNGITVK